MSRKNNSTPARRTTKWLSIGFLLLVTPLVLQPAVLARAKQGQNMCAPCDTLIEKFRIVHAKSKSFEEGLKLLRQTRRELQTNTNIANGLAATYATLQGVNIAFGPATLPCSIPQRCLKSLIGGSSRPGCLRAGRRRRRGDAGGRCQFHRSRRRERRYLDLRFHATLPCRIGRAQHPAARSGSYRPKIREHTGRTAGRTANP